MSDFESEDEDIEFVSKTQMKKESHALQKLAEDLTELKEEQLATIPLDDHLLAAIRETRSITKREALRRHRQYLGKLMRKTDNIEEIEQAYQAIVDAHNQSARQLHQVENWRDQMIADVKNMEAFIQKFPGVDRQQLRQLVQAAKKEQSQDKAPASARKLFKFIREEMARANQDAY